ncbi:uncharacterized protein [Oscarella lobularis]|uniref:uncharacterized protein n=1 Tax=Oscarella lobularis TaxID=121494 RepID=UPI0033138D5A
MILWLSALLFRLRLWIFDLFNLFFPSHRLALSAQTILDRAIEAVGREPPPNSITRSPKWIEGLERLIPFDSGALRYSSRLLVEKSLVDATIRVIKMEILTIEFPKIFALSPPLLKRPIIVSGGMARSATTILQYLLCCYDDTLAFTLPQSKAVSHVDVARCKDGDTLKAMMTKGVAREIKSMKILKKAGYMLPDRIYNASETSPASCVSLLDKYLHRISFATLDGILIADSSSLNENASFSRLAYQRYLNDLKLFANLYSDSSSHQRLVLKTSFHSIFTDDLVDVFPDACLIRCLRDPVDAVPSLASFFYETRRWLCRSDSEARRGVGDFALRAQSVRCRETVRQEGKRRFFDVRFSDIVRDPISVCQSIAGAFGLKHDVAVEERLRAFLDKQAQLKKTKWGKNVYSLEEYGLTVEKIRQDTHIKEFCDLFGY